MERCKICVMPSTRPDHVFVDGVCPACINHEKTDHILGTDALQELLDRHNGEVIVPSSGGKDSNYQVLRLIELGARPTVVTATTCHLTEIGRKNIDNLSRFANTIEISPNKTIRAKLNRLGLELAGDISWPEHASIFSAPFRVAAETGIKLIMYGENPQHQYGGPEGTEDAVLMTERWVNEFGGFLGLRPSDFIGFNGITSRDMVYYHAEHAPGVEAHFLGQYERWDSKRNWEVAVEHGMKFELPSPANWWEHENLDNAQTGLHDRFMFLKYGYSRGCTQISVDVRNGIVNRDYALDWVREHDGVFPVVYAGVHVDEVLDRIGMSTKELVELEEHYTNWDIFDRDSQGRPVLKC